MTDLVISIITIATITVVLTTPGAAGIITNTFHYINLNIRAVIGSTSTSHDPI